jgi:phospholipase/carboxylesterase
MALPFVHQFVPGQSNLLLVLFHGTGGNENDLVPLGRALAPGAALLSPRGKVLENGMPRYFRRIAEGVFDEKDLRERAAEMSAFLGEARKEYKLESAKTILCGYSNGANIAASLFLLHPDELAGGILFRPMLPLHVDHPSELPGIPLYMASGRNDPLVPVESVLALEKCFRESGAEVTLHWSDEGHRPASHEFSEARNWLTQHFPAT